MTGFARFLGVDWSGARTGANQRIFVAEAVREGEQLRLVTVVRAADRSAVEAWLGGGHLERSPAWRDWKAPAPPRPEERTLVGLDFAFGFPAAFSVPRYGATWSWEQLLTWAGQLDSGDLEAGLDDQFRRGPSQAKMHKRQTELAAELVGVRPESVLNLVGARQVGRGSIRGMAMLARLRESIGVACWPFDAASTSAALVLGEVFPRLWLDVRGKEDAPVRVKQLECWTRAGTAIEERAALACAASPDALDAAAAARGLAEFACLPALPHSPQVRREGWIIGVTP